MASPGLCLAQLSRICLASPVRQSILHLPQKALIPTFQVRHAAFKPRTLSKKEKAGILTAPPKKKSTKKGEKEQKKRKPRTTYRQYDLKDAEQFSLCDAMRYVFK